MNGSLIKSKSGNYKPSILQFFPSDGKDQNHKNHYFYCIKKLMSRYLAMYHTIARADVTALASVLALQLFIWIGMCLLHHLSFVAGKNFTSIKFPSSS